MTLLFYSPRFYPLVGGLESVVKAWGNELVAKGVSVTLVTTTPCDEADRYAFEVVRRPGFGRLVRLIREADAVIKFNVSLKSIPAVLAGGKPLIITHHTFLVEPGKNPGWQQYLKRWLSNRLPVLNISCSHFVASQFKQSAVIHSPYNSSLFRNRGLARKPKSLVFAGRLVTDKGVNLLLQALQLLEPGSFSRLVIAGDGPERQRLEDIAARNGLNNKVVFRGKVLPEELVLLLNESAVMVVPSIVEPFGITVLEGLACGCRMVVSDAGGLPEAAGGLARLFSNGDVPGLARAIQEALADDNTPDDIAVQAHLQRLTVAFTGEQFYAAIAGALGFKPVVSVGEDTNR